MTATDTPNISPTSIHPATTMGLVALRVADLGRSLRFYEEVIGFERLDQAGDEATLGAGSVPLLRLRAVAGLQPTPTRATGLYHFAILLPSPADLGRALQRLIAARVAIGQGDHLVSEALYLSDPDGNGIEMYRDRPRSSWRWQGGQVQMATDPVDLQALLDAAARDGGTSAHLPAGTSIGHVHLKVGDVAQAREFYHDLLGFDVMAQMPGALFVSAGGYHHHLGLNAWHSRGAAPTPADAAGLDHFSIVLPTADEQRRLLARLAAAGVGFEEQEGQTLLRDLWDNQIALVVAPAP